MISKKYLKLKSNVIILMNISLLIGFISLVAMFASVFFTNNKIISDIFLSIFICCLVLCCYTFLFLWKCPKCNAYFGSSIKDTCFCPHCGVNLEADEYREKFRPAANTEFNDAKTREVRDCIAGKNFFKTSVNCPYCSARVINTSYNVISKKPRLVTWAKWCFICGASFSKSKTPIAHDCIEKKMPLNHH